MVRRLPSQPPVLPGFTFVHVLGSGGFADVFLYEQNMPRRQVAVKVMLNEVVNDSVRQMFQAEANLMAQLSSHPSILTVYQASVSSDGRPYLVMEFCSAILADRYRRERIPVAEVLRISVKIGSAIETAHRAGVLHRDIKPSNILLTAYGHPVLSDFGIASTLGEVDSQEMVGMSIPWSAPEVLLDETSGTVQSEVWSFAATVYSLLAGRSPFEVPGGSNKSADLMTRIGKAKTHPIGRPDVPASLERVLSAGMSRRPDARPQTVLELVRELQAVESELGVPQTQIEVAMNDWALSSVSNLEDRTRIRSVAGAVPVATRRRRHSPVVESGTYAGLGTIVRATGTGARSTGAATAGPTGSMRWIAGGSIALTVLALAVGVPLALTLADAQSSDTPVVTDIVAELSRTAVDFSWTDPTGLSPSDSYQITTNGGAPSIQSRPSFTVAAESGDRICLTVAVNRDGRSGPPSSEKCVDFG